MFHDIWERFGLAYVSRVRRGDNWKFGRISAVSKQPRPNVLVRATEVGVTVLRKGDCFLIGLSGDLVNRTNTALVRIELFMEILFGPTLRNRIHI